jgi:hypothetical protein
MSVAPREDQEKIDAFVRVEALAGKEIASVLNNNGVKGKIAPWTLIRTRWTGSKKA